MRVKVFSAPQLHAALALVRKEMGPDALILDREQVNDNQGNSIWRVHAAFDENPVANISPQIPKKSNARTAKQDEPSHSVSAATLHRLERLVEGLGNRESATLRQALSAQDQEAFDHLVRLGVAPSHAFDMAEDFSQKNGISSKQLLWGKRIAPTTQRECLLFAGPSGSGKTTLVAKLAAHYSIKGLRVAVVSTDSERMGGLDTLRSYASTLGIPFFAPRKSDDIAKIIEQTHSAQLLLIDSEGWSPRRDTCLKRQSVLWQGFNCSRRVLVVPANMDEEDGMQLLAHRETSTMTDIAFSKLDETQSPGKIVNWAVASRLPMSYCSFGPEVPEQMGWLTAQAVTTLLCKHEREPFA